MRTWETKQRLSACAYHFSKKKVQITNLPSFDVIAHSVGLEHLVQLVLRHGVRRGLGVLGEHLV